MAEMEPDELLTLRASFYAGAFHKALDECSLVIVDSEDLRQLTISYRVRSLLALGRDIPSSIDRSLPLVAALLAPDEPTLNKVAIRTHPEMLCAALSYQRLGNTRQALTILDGLPAALEPSALRIRCFVDIDRSDLLEEEYKAMTMIDEDDVLTMTTCAILASLGVGSVAQSRDLIADLIRRFGNTLFLTELDMSLAMKNGQFSDALQSLDKARTVTTSLSSTMLVNSIVCLEHINNASNDALMTSLVEELQTRYPDDAFFTMTRRVQETFA